MTKHRKTGWLRVVPLLAGGALVAPGCAVTETGNPKTEMGFGVVNNALTRGPVVRSASLSLSRIDIESCDDMPVVLSSPAPPVGADLVAGAATQWDGTTGDVCRCDVGQSELVIVFEDPDSGDDRRFELRGDASYRLTAADGPYGLEAGRRVVLGYDLSGFLGAVDLDALSPQGGTILVNGSSDPAAVERLVAELAPYVGLYPDWNEDGQVDDDELASPLAVAP